MNLSIENAPRNLKLTEKGKNFIRSICNGSGRYRLDGKMDKPLPSCNPPTPPSKIWYSNATWNNKKIIDDTMFGEALIYWFDELASEFKIDPNIVASRIFIESTYCVWSYNTDSTAMGLQQSTQPTTYDLFFSIGYSKYWKDDEVAAMTKNLINFTEIINNKVVVIGKPRDIYNDNEIGRTNRPFLFQNMVDNPKLCLKAAFVYMSTLADKLNGLASSTILSYALGGGIESQTYTGTIEKQYVKKAYRNDKSIVDGGIISTTKTFNILRDKFGYDLGDNYNNDNRTLAFDSFNINAIESLQKNK